MISQLVKAAKALCTHVNCIKHFAGFHVVNGHTKGVRSIRHGSIGCVAGQHFVPSNPFLTFPLDLHIQVLNLVSLESAKLW